MRQTRAGVEKENQALAASSTIVGVPRAKKSDTGGRWRATAGADERSMGWEWCGWVGSGME